MLPSIDDAGIESAANSIANALRAAFRWHENFTSMDRVPQVGTNIGTFIFYGLKEPVEVGKQGDLVVTEARPHSVTLIACSKVPTSQQKVILIDLIAMRVASKLGVPKGTPVAKKDPLRPEGPPNLLAGVTLAQAERKTEEAVVSAGASLDLYKTITTPYMITIVWKPEGGFDQSFDIKR